MVYIIEVSRGTCTPSKTNIRKGTKIDEEKDSRSAAHRRTAQLGQGSTPAPGTEGNGESKASTSALATITNKDKDPLALGMTQAEVEAILPMVSGSESEAMGTTYAYFGTEPENQVYVGFMDGVATTLSVGGNFQTQQPLESSNWSLEGVTLGAKRADVEKALGKPTKEEPVPITGRRRDHCG